MLRGLICYYRHTWGRKINYEIRFCAKMDSLKLRYLRASLDRATLTDIKNHVH